MAHYTRVTVQFRLFRLAIDLVKSNDCPPGSIVLLKKFPLFVIALSTPVSSGRKTIISNRRGHDDEN